MVRAQAIVVSAYGSPLTQFHLLGLGTCPAKDTQTPCRRLCWLCAVRALDLAHKGLSIVLASLTFFVYSLILRNRAARARHSVAEFKDAHQAFGCLGAMCCHAPLSVIPAKAGIQYPACERRTSSRIASRFQTWGWVEQCFSWRSTHTGFPPSRE